LRRWRKKFDACPRQWRIMAASRRLIYE